MAFSHKLQAEPILMNFFFFKSETLFFRTVLGVQKIENKESSHMFSHGHPVSPVINILPWLDAFARVEGPILIHYY